MGGPGCAPVDGIDVPATKREIKEDAVNPKVRLAVLLCATMVIAISGFSQSKSPLQGVWKAVDVVTTGPNASTNKSPQPGLIIFTGKYYSVVAVTSDKPRPELPQDMNTPTAVQFRDVWNPFLAQSGTYEVKGSEITYHPIVAKNPRAMSSATSLSTPSRSKVIR